MQQTSSPDFDELRAFIALADAGTFAGAAKRIGRDAAIVSRRVQALERRLGIRLAERSTRRVALTEAGLAYLAQVRPLLLSLEEADQEAAAFAGGEPRGHLRITLPASFGQLWLRPLIIEFLAAHPLVTLEVESSNRFIDLIGERYDLAIRLGVLPDSRLVARKIADRRRLLVASPAFLKGRPAVARPADLTAHPCLCSANRADPFQWTFENADLGKESVVVGGPLVSDDAGLLVDAAVAGLGILQSTDWYVHRDVAAGRLVEVMSDWPVLDHGAVYIVVPATGGLPSKTRAFSEWMSRKLARPPWTIRSAPESPI